MSFPSGDARLVLSDACDSEGVGGRVGGGGCRVVLAHEHAAGRRLGLGGAVLSAGWGGFRRWHDEVVMGGAVAVGLLYSNRLEH